ncbi:hypothetical protein KY290_013925 [Solanum tuberosum]|uniref:Uncharacterized protein n=1 Tax=Solanum tuberosum TaxID=4113 RepID=A0ABQ7VN67_SOLTU|nr:hypothetical protein KY284_015630 [Solanum tuberosum]KAH0696557.1 hypothetical protein KY289_014039 [Solanum tuberosum]KAH0717315.1 hypothetical protein KY285_013346 [Solanum tuberosum]KAH0769944.1 hypothetical protein KY290_013925 [Solanum tuberosum]
MGLVAVRRSDGVGSGFGVCLNYWVWEAVRKREVWLLFGSPVDLFTINGGTRERRKVVGSVVVGFWCGLDPVGHNSFSGVVNSPEKMGYYWVFLDSEDDQGKGSNGGFVCWRKWEKTNGVLVVDLLDSGGNPATCRKK